MYLRLRLFRGEVKVTFVLFELILNILNKLILDKNIFILHYDIKYTDIFKLIHFLNFNSLKPLLLYQLSNLEDLTYEFF